ncbi:IS66 family insertion sequence element accessory protein TnpA [Alicyclobacillus macrosporangiidus]|uniref:IS66 family insertion sequence element accessory protein TnpA n=1 Tax=Alicyclobacillus macrosporangiidus TaxID=392015 RepID=UPI003CCB9ADC
MADFRASRQTGAAWCAAHHVKEHQLWYWVSKFKAESAPEQPRFIPVQVHESVEEAEVLIPPLYMEIMASSSQLSRREHGVNRRV